MPKSVLKKPHSPQPTTNNNDNTIMEEIQKLEKQNKKLEDEKNALLASLHAESVANEEQAAYIEILKRTLERKLDEIGVAGQGQLIVENEILRNKVTQCENALNEASNTIARLEDDIELYKRHGEIVQQTRRSLSPINGNGLNYNLQKNLNFNSDIAIPGLKSEIENLRALVDRLEKEKMTLLDYAQESLDKAGKLAEEIDYLENFNRAQMGEKSKLEQQVKELLSQLQEINKNSSNAKDKSTQDKEENNQTKEDKEEKEKEIEKLKEIVREKEIEIEELMSMQVEMLDAVKDLKDQKNGEDEETHNLETKILQLEKDLEGAANQIKELTAKEQIYQQELTQKSTEIDSLNNTLHQTQEDLAKIQTKNEKRKQKLTNVEKQNQSTTEFISKIRSDWELEISQKNEIINELRAQYDIQKKKCEDLENEIANYSLELSSSQIKIQSQLSALEQEIDAIKSENANLFIQNKSLVSSLQISQQHEEDLESELLECKEKLTLIENEVGIINNEVLAANAFRHKAPRESLEFVLTENKKNLEKKGIDKEDGFRKALEHSNYQLEKQLVLVSELEKTVYVERNENKRLTENISVISQKCEEMKLRLETKQIEADHLTRTVTMMGLDKAINENDFITTLKRELVERSKELSILQARISELRIRSSAQASESQLQVAQLQSQVSKLQSEIEGIQNEARAAIKERDDELNSCAYLCAQVCESIRSDSDQTCSILKTELAAAKETIANLEASLIRSRDSADMHNKDSLRLARQLEQAQSMQQNSMNELNDCYGKIKDLESKLGNKSAEIQFMQSQLKALKSVDEPTRSSATELEHLRNELQAMYDSYRKEQNNAIDLSNKIGELQSQLENLQVIVAKRDSKNSEFYMQENRLLQEKLEEATGKLDRTQQLLFDTESAFERERLKVESFERENESLTRKTEELTKLAISRPESPIRDKKDKDNASAKRFELIRQTLALSQQQYGPSKNTSKTTDIEKRLDRIQQLYNN